MRGLFEGQDGAQFSRQFWFDYLAYILLRPDAIYEDPTVRPIRNDLVKNQQSNNDEGYEIIP